MNSQWSRACRVGAPAAAPPPSSTAGDGSQQRRAPRRALPPPAKALLAATLLLTALVAAATTAPTPAAAHSSLHKPVSMSYATDCRIGGPPGFIRNCPGPCPNMKIRRTGRGSSVDKPAIVIGRGASLPVVWGRNNHEGGFIRWSIVGVADQWKWDAHRAAAFHWNCFSAGRFNCGSGDGKACADDSRNEAFRDVLRVPAIYPDGDYVLSWVRWREGAAWGGGWRLGGWVPWLFGRQAARLRFGLLVRRFVAVEP